MLLSLRNENLAIGMTEYQYSRLVSELARLVGLQSADLHSGNCSIIMVDGVRVRFWPSRGTLNTIWVSVEQPDACIKQRDLLYGAALMFNDLALQGSDAVFSLTQDGHLALTLELDLPSHAGGNELATLLVDALKETTEVRNKILNLINHADLPTNERRGSHK